MRWSRRMNMLRLMVASSSPMGQQTVHLLHPQWFSIHSEMPCTPFNWEMDEVSEGHPNAWAERLKRRCREWFNLVHPDHIGSDKGFVVIKRSKISTHGENSTRALLWNCQFQTPFFHVGVSFACSFTGTDKNASDALETSCGLRQDTNYFMKPGAKKEQLSRQVLERTRAPHEWGALRRECQDVRENVRQNVKLFARKDIRYCQIERQNKYAIYTSRWYVRSYVRIVVQGGDHSKKVILFCLCSLLGAGAHAIFFRGRQALFFVVWRGNDASLCFRMCVLEIYVAQKPQDTPGRSPPFCFWKRWNFGSIIFCV